MFGSRVTPFFGTPTHPPQVSSGNPAIGGVGELGHRPGAMPVAATAPQKTQASTGRAEPNN